MRVCADEDNSAWSMWGCNTWHPNVDPYASTPFVQLLSIHPLLHITLPCYEVLLTSSMLRSSIFHIYILNYLCPNFSPKSKKVKNFKIWHPKVDNSMSINHLATTLSLSFQENSHQSIFFLTIPKLGVKFGHCMIDIYYLKRTQF